MLSNSRRAALDREFATLGVAIQWTFGPGQASAVLLPFEECADQARALIEQSGGVITPPDGRKMPRGVVRIHAAWSADPADYGSHVSRYDP